MNPRRENPTSTAQRPSAAARLAWSAATVVVAGMLLSGMSRSVVTPPAAAARVALGKPSQSARPGSLTCTWVSTSPGKITASPASTTRAPSGTVVERGDRDDATAGNVDRRVANAGRNGDAAPADHQARSGHVALPVSSQNRRSRFAATSRR